MASSSPAPENDRSASLTARLGHALMMLESAYRDLRRGMAEEIGLSLAEFHALVAVAGSPGYTPKLLGRELTITTGSVTALLDRLEHAGLLTRLPNPQDRRSVLLALNPHGDDLLRQIVTRHDAAVTEMQSTSPSLADPVIVEDLTRAAAVLAAHSLAKASVSN